MFQPSKKRVLKFQKTFKEKYGKKLTFTEATEAINNLVGFFSLLLKIDRQNKGKIKKQKVK